jgi:hypothetical protein
MFEKHLPSCLTIQGEKRGGATLNEDHNASRVQTLGLKKHLSSMARINLTQALGRVGAENKQRMNSENRISDGPPNSKENIRHSHRGLKRAHHVREFILV